MAKTKAKKTKKLKKDKPKKAEVKKVSDSQPLDLRHLPYAPKED